MSKLFKKKPRKVQSERVNQLRKQYENRMTLVARLKYSYNGLRWWHFGGYWKMKSMIRQFLRSSTIRECVEDDFIDLSDYVKIRQPKKLVELKENLKEVEQLQQRKEKKKALKDLPENERIAYLHLNERVRRFEKEFYEIRDDIFFTQKLSRMKEITESFIQDTADLTFYFYK